MDSKFNWKRAIFLLILLIMLSTVLLAKSLELSVSSYVDKTTLTINEYLQLTVEIQANKNVEVEPIIPQLTGFQIVEQSSSSSTSIQIINGKMTKSISKNFIYSLAPLKIGKFVIPPILIKYKNKQYRTNAIEIKILASKTTAKPNTKKKYQQNKTQGSVKGKKIFLRAISTKEKVYVGEPFAIIYKLYSRENLVGLNAEKMPEFPGFLKENIFQAQNIRYTIEALNGVRYYTYKISEYTLFPTKSGTFIIDPMQLICSYKVPARNFFDFGTTKR